MEVKKYFNRFFWQILKGLSQLALIFIVPGIIGQNKFMRLDYIITLSRSFSSFFDGFLSYQYQDEYLDKTKVNRAMLGLFYVVGAILLSMFLILFQLEVNQSVVIVLFTVYFFTDIFVKLFDLSESYLFSSVIRLMISLLLVIVLLVMGDIHYAVYSLLLIPILSYALFPSSEYYDKANISNFIGIVVMYGPLILYGMFSLLYSVIDRTFLITDIDSDIAVKFSYISRVLALLGFFISSATTLIYKDAVRLELWLSNRNVIRWVAPSLVLISSLAVVVLSFAFKIIFDLKLSIDVWLLIMIYLPVQILGSILITMSLRFRKKLTHIIEGISAMTIALIIEWILFKKELFIEGILVKLIVTSILWSWFLIRGLKIERRTYYELVSLVPLSFLLRDVGLDLFGALCCISVIYLCYLILQTYMQTRRVF